MPEDGESRRTTTEADERRPSDNSADYTELVSALSSDDLAVPAEVTEPANEDAFVFDPDADPDGTFPQSVASGDPTPSGVVLWTRIDPESYDLDDPLAVEVAHDPDFEERVYRGVVGDREAVHAHDYTV